MNATSPPSPSRSGCGGLLLTTLVTCLALVPNGWIAVVLVSSLRGVTPLLLESPKVAQVFVFVVPVLLIVIEWWVFDRLRDIWNERRSRRSHA